MAVAASIPRGNVVPLWHERRYAFLRAVHSRTDRQVTRRARHRAAARDSGRVFLKRAFDVVGASAGLLFFAPLLIAIAITPLIYLGHRLIDRYLGHEAAEALARRAAEGGEGGRVMPEAG